MGFKLLSFIFIPSSNEDNVRINENDTLNSKGDLKMTEKMNPEFKFVDGYGFNED